MVILGLGSNVGDRLENLRKALRAIQSLANITVIQVSPVYLSDALLPENAPPEWDMPHLNCAIRCETTLDPFELLKTLKSIEWTIGRKPEIRHWGPRILDIDILAWDNRIIQTEALNLPHESLQDRPFALWPLSDIAPTWQFPLPGQHYQQTAAQMVEKWGSRFSGDAPLHTKQILQRIDTPRLMGVLNVTPDSFSDGGLFQNPDKAIEHALALIKAGAEIIDIGAESTSPKAQAISAEVEWQRIAPILQVFHHHRSKFLLPPKISIDTRHVAVASKAIEMGIDYINDVSGLDDDAMKLLIAESKVDCVVMHHICIPERRDQVLPRHEAPQDLVLEWGEKRLQELEKFGITREQIIFDPGIGFGKLAEQSLLVLQHIARFKELNVRILVGHSRKTFMSLLTDQVFANRDAETLAISLYLANQPVDYLRVHNVEMCARGLKAFRAVGLKQA